MGSDVGCEERNDTSTCNEGPSEIDRKQLKQKKEKKKRRRRSVSSSPTSSKSSDRKPKLRKEKKSKKRKDKEKPRLSQKEPDSDARGPVQLSKHLHGDDSKYSAITGSKIKLKRETSKSDKEEEAKRQRLLEYLNSSYE